MKKSRVILIIVLVLVLLAALFFGVRIHQRRKATEAEAAALAAAAQAEAERRAEEMSAAEAAQQEAYDRYALMVNNEGDYAAAPALIVTENGETVGTYSLARLGLAKELSTEIDAAFNETERMIPTVFAALSYEEKMAAACEVKSPVLTLPQETLTLDAVFADLEAAERRPAVDAHTAFADGAYHIVAEEAGTELRLEPIEAALREAAAAVTVGVDGVEPVSVELTELDCYVQPTQTAEAMQVDYQTLLEADLANLSLSLDFQGVVETLDPAQYVSVDADGKLQVDEAALTAQADAWAEMYDRAYAPYILDTYLEGPVPMRFLLVSYALDKAALTEQLKTQLLTLRSAELEVPFLCTQNGKPFSLGDTYVEVDVKNQVMTYFKDGEVLVSTDVVTGSAWLSPTPEGLYDVDNKIPETWLYGTDYAVYVDYWVGFIDNWYGLHDAQWRTDFGSDWYIRSGSHGCVNTPTEPMAKIYEDIEVGTYVIIHGPYRD